MVYMSVVGGSPVVHWLTGASQVVHWGFMVKPSPFNYGSECYHDFCEYNDRLWLIRLDIRIIVRIIHWAHKKAIK